MEDWEEQKKRVQEWEHKLIEVENDVQDKSTIAWKKLCEYVEKVALEGSDEFSPAEYLGQDLFSKIYTLPETIAKLKKVKKVWLYGSQLKRIPPEIGEMESLEYFDPYTSYNLQWFPYEITKCKNLKDSRISTRALYGNYKYRRPFPDLTSNQVRYDSDILTCSVCKKEITYEETNQLWISLGIGTDVVPLLANLCSNDCEHKLPKPAEDYVQFAHKGGKKLKQPLDQNKRWKIEQVKRQEQEKSSEVTTKEDIFSKIADENKKDNKIEVKGLPVLKLIRKIWEK